MPESRTLTPFNSPSKEGVKKISSRLILYLED